jgi:carbohydrate-selective porin OprB
MGYSPTVLMFPTYPDPRLSVMIAFDPSRRVGGSAALYDGDGDARFAIAEGRTAWTIGRLPGRARAGVWHHTGEFTRLDGSGIVDRGANGPYFTVEQSVWDARPRQVSVFLQYGHANPLVSALDEHVSWGVVWRGLSARRAADAAGVGMTRVRLSGAAMNGPSFRVESVLGAFYSRHLGSHVRIEPDLQYVTHSSGGVPQHAHLEATFRLRTEFQP